MVLEKFLNFDSVCAKSCLGFQQSSNDHLVALKAVSRFVGSTVNSDLSFKNSCVLCLLAFG